jgi:hypothetical protein
MHPIPRATRRAPGLGPTQRCDVALAAVGIAAITAVGIPAWGGGRRHPRGCHRASAFDTVDP